MLNFILYGLAVAAQLLLCFLVYYATNASSKNMQKRLRARFYFLSASTIMWSLSQSAYDWSKNLTYQGLILRFGTIATIFTGVAFLAFTFTLVGKHRIRRDLIYIPLVLSALVPAIFVNFFELSTQSTGEIVYSYNFLIYGYITLVPILIILRAILLLFTTRKHTRIEVRRRQYTTILHGMLLSASIAFLGNFLMVYFFGDSALSSIIVALTPVVFTFTIVYAVFSLKLFNFRKFLFRAVVGFISYVVPLIGILYVFAFGATRLLEISSVAVDSIVGRLTYIFGVLIGIITVILGKKYFSRWISLVFVKNQMSEQDFALAVEQLVKSEFSEELATKFAKLCKQFLAVDKVILFVGGKSDSDMSEQKTIGSSMQPFDEDSEITQLYGEIETHGKRKTVDDSGFVEDVRLLADKDVNYVLRYEQAGLHGAVFLGSKLNGQRYYNDEINIVRKGLVEVLLAMQNVFRLKQLIEFNQSLEERIIQATKELRHTNDKLRALDEAKDEFISMASHQLRTPLTSIKGYVSLILDGDMGKVPIKQRKMLNEAFSSSQRMVYLISDLLNVSRLKTGKFMIEASDVYLPDVVEEEIDQVREMAEVKNIKIHYEKPKIFTHLQLDDMKIRQVIMNFIDNAIHYTPEGGSISVVLLENQKSIDFTVVDSGIGVPKSEQHHLFTKFYRAGNARKARPDGTGLGLFMAKKVIIASGGSIIFSSQEGSGSTFGFTFPKNNK